LRFAMQLSILHDDLYDTLFSFLSFSLLSVADKNRPTRRPDYVISDNGLIAPVASFTREYASSRSPITVGESRTAGCRPRLVNVAVTLS